MASPESKLPIDTNVPVPAAVQAGIDAANAAHAAAYAPEPDPAKVAADAAAAAQNAPAEAPAQLDPAPQDARPQPEPALSKRTDRAGVDPATLEGQYYSMEGRYRQSQQIVGQLQEQLREMGDEMVRLQDSVQQRQQPVRKNAQSPLITDEDVKTYGPELLDTIQRAARAAVEPDLAQLTTQNRKTSQTVAERATQDLYRALDADFPEWRTINNDPRFREWCRLPDVYSGAVRGKLLNAAFHAADAPRVANFFKGFRSEEVATGNAPEPTADQRPSDPAPRKAAVALETLTAPGRAKPAPGGSNPGSAEKPVYTRGQVAAFYRNVNSGKYVGREAEKAADEKLLFDAQNEGRIRG